MGIMRLVSDEATRNLLARWFYDIKDSEANMNKVKSCGS